MKNAFFCEACGAEVKGKADHCPSCGRSFLGIRCPRCGKEGTPDEFLKGCPDCGYTADTRPSGDAPHHIPLEWPARKEDSHRAPWPVSRYLVLSSLIVIAMAVIIYWWMK